MSTAVMDTPAMSPLLSGSKETIRLVSSSSYRSAVETPVEPLSTHDDIALTPPSDDDSQETENWNITNLVNNLNALGLAFGLDELPMSPPKQRFVLEDIIPDGDDAPVTRPHLESKPPFERWMKTLNKKATLRRRSLSQSHTLGIAALDPDLYSLPGFDGARSRHRKSISGSSLGFVTAMKSASVSLASMSIAPRSRKMTRSLKYTKTDRSSRALNIGPCTSEDSAYTARSIVNDTAVTNRAIRRRHVLEEIIRTEEGYCGDIKFLMTVYVNFLHTIPTIAQNLRASIERNLNEIAELHEEILGDLHRVVPHSEYSQDDFLRAAVPRENHGHQRWRSLDAVPEHAGDLSWLQKFPGVTAEAYVGAEVARVFGKRIHRFFAYEEYGAKYETMVKDLASARGTIPQWDEYQKGLEVFAAAVSSANLSKDQPHRALVVGDLLVKPIQRVCRYPLLFAELLKQTPVCDCPESHIEIEKVLARMRETTNQINRATDDPRMKATLEKTWLLQDRLLVPDQIDPRSKSLIRTLGHNHLCGVLHVTWRTRDGVEGDYMVALLYRDCLVLASVGRNENVYHVRAMISFCDMRVENADNGRGLQCHTAPHSFKIVLECDHQLFELILSACSPKEELEWRSRLVDRAGREHISGCEQAFFTSAWFGIRSIGSVFGKPGTIARRLSIHRATTVGPKSPLCQVIIKNTSALKDASTSSSNAAINRSQSLLTTNRIPIIAPSRSERVRLEKALVDVWTRHILPYPAMTGRSRGGHLVRSSASSMMRKLSVASITSSFSGKRSGSVASLSNYGRPSEEQHHHPDIRASSGGVASISSADDKRTTTVEVNSILPPVELDDDFDVVFDEKSMNVQKSRTPTPTLVTVQKMKRLASSTLRVKGVLDINRKTPPLRAASDPSVKGPIGARKMSGNSMTQLCTSPGSDRSRESENQYPHKQEKWAKSAGLHRLISTERLGRCFT